MLRLWSVTIHTLKQCLRAKVAAMFICLLLFALLAMPFLKVLKGDGTLAGQIQTFLSYSMTVTAGLLSLMTILLSASLVSNDVRSKQIFSVATKPLARWEYIVGRWLGIAVLNALLLGVAGGAIYGFAQYLRRGEALKTTTGRADDRRRVETEVFAARTRVAPDQVLDVEEAIAGRIAQLKEQKRYQGTLQAFVEANQGDETKGYEHLLRELKKQALSKVQSVRPNGVATWSFSGVHAAGREWRGVGRIVKVGTQRRVVAVKADELLIGKLTYDGPVRVGGVEGRIIRLDADSFVVGFWEEDVPDVAVASMVEGKEVEVVAEPTVQVTYKATASSRPPDGTISSFWEVQNPSDNTLYQQKRNDAVDVPATLTLPARVIDADGRTIVRYLNLAPGNTVTIQQEDIAVLYQVGNFGPNLWRGMLLIFVQMAFLAALGVLAGSFVSFPVACLVCFSMLPFQIARSFLLDAVRPLPGIRTDVITYINNYLVRGINRLLPDFGNTFPGKSLVDGMYVSWPFVGETVFWTLCVQTVLLLTLACVLFRKRELARVQI